MVNIKKIVFNRVTALALSSITLSSLGTMVVNVTKEKPLEISKGIYDGIYLDNNTGIKPRYYYINNIPSLYHDISLNTKLDISINSLKLNQIKSIKIDLNASNLGDLSNLPNLDTVLLYNLNCLTNNDIYLLNKFENIKNINLLVDFNYLNYSLNANLFHFKNKKIFIQKGDNIDNDLYDLYIYKLYNELYSFYKEDIKLLGINEIRINQLNKWENEIEDIIISLNFGEDSSDSEKIINIIKYVTDILDYDPQIMELISENKFIADDSSLIYYNEKVLESILDDNSKYGVCCNFASLTSAIARYCNILFEYKTGTYNSGINSNHAWCKYNDNIVDTTLLDNNIIYNIKKENYELFSHSINYEMLENDILRTILIDGDNDSYKENDNFIIKEGKDIVNINTNSDLFNKNLLLQIKLNLFICLSSLILLGIDIGSIINEKEKIKKYIY